MGTLTLFAEVEMYRARVKELEAERDAALARAAALEEAVKSLMYAREVFDTCPQNIKGAAIDAHKAAYERLCAALEDRSE